MNYSMIFIKGTNDLTYCPFPVCSALRKSNQARMILGTLLE